MQQRILTVSREIHKNRNIAQVFCVFMSVCIYVLVMLRGVSKIDFFQLGNNMIFLLNFQLSVSEEIDCLNTNCTNSMENLAILNDIDPKDCKPFDLVDVSHIEFIF